MFAAGAGLSSLLLVSIVGAGPGLPLGMPPADENPLIARIAPQHCVAYLGWAGSASPDANSENRAERLLAEPDVQQFAAQLEKLLADLFLKQATRERPETQKLAAVAAVWSPKLLVHPGAVFLSRFVAGDSGPDVEAGFVVDLGDEAGRFKREVSGELAKLLPGLGIPFEISLVDGLSLFTIRTGEGSPPISLGMKDSLLIVGVGRDAVPGILKRSLTAPPAWLTDVRERLPVARPSLVAYVDAKKLAEIYGLVSSRGNANKALLSMLQASGLHKLSTVAAVAGFGETDFVTRVRCDFDGQPSGLLAATQAQPLSADDLRSIPQDATFAVATRLDLAATLDAVIAALAQQHSDFPGQASGQIERISTSLGFHLRTDLLDSLGDVWCLYHSPGEGGYLLGFAGVVSVRDRNKLAAIERRILDSVASSQPNLADIRRNSGMRFRPRLNKLAWNDHVIYSFSGVGDVPIAPAWCLAKDQLIVAPFPQNIKAYLSRGDDFQSLGSLPSVTAMFEGPNKPVKLYYQDTARLMRLAYPLTQFAARMLSAELARNEIDFDVSLIPTGSKIVNHLGADTIAVSWVDNGFEVTLHESAAGSVRVVPLALTAGFAIWTMESREARQIAESISILVSPQAANEMIAKNSLKQIGLALHNYHDTHRRFPAAFTSDKEGKPLLSWRVQVLPYLEQQALYERFHHDEPWDSDHNKALIPLMPAVYASPGGGQDGGRGQTSFLTIRHTDSLMPGEGKIRFADVTDGSSLTIAVVEASEEAAVTWTRPDDYAVDDDKDNAPLVGRRSDGFLALFADGSVHKLKSELDVKTFRSLWNRHDGQSIDLRRVIVGEGYRRGPLIGFGGRDYPTVNRIERTDELRIDDRRDEVDREPEKARDEAFRRPAEPPRDDSPAELKEEGAKP